MRIKKIGIWAGLILSLLIMGVKTPVYAADSGYAAVKSDSVKMITDLRLTSLDEPVPGVPLDTKATIVSAEGVTWDIPVVWIDESGKTVTVRVPSSTNTA